MSDKQTIGPFSELIANFKEVRREKLIGEFLMETQSLPSRLWVLLVTNKGIHFVYFRDIPLFEIILMAFILLAIISGSLLNGFNKITILTCILLLITIIYYLDRGKIEKRWEKFSGMELREKIFSDKRNMHFRKGVIQKIFADCHNVVITADTGMYRFKYYSVGDYSFQDGQNPFLNKDARINEKKSELNVEKVFSMEIWRPLFQEGMR